MVLRSISACTPDSMHPSQTIPLLLVSLCPSHVHFILLTVVLPVSISIRAARVLYFPSPRLPVPRHFRSSVSRKRLFYISRWLDEETPGEPVRIVWRGAILDRTYSEFFALPPWGNHRAPGSARLPSCIRLSAAEKQCARPWQTYASLGDSLREIMLSAAYALRSATSAKSRREFYCGPPSRYAR